jgi:hypothetical protein
MTDEQHADQTAAAFVVEQIHLTLDRLRESWEWVVELVVPGHATSSSAAAVTDDQAERLEALGHSDRAYRAWNLRHGMSALPPSPAAARLAALDAPGVIAMCVIEAAHLAAAAADSVWVGGQPQRVATVRAALDWFDRPAVLDDVRDQAAAVRIDKLLQRADRTARAAAHCEDDEVSPLHDRCPACGRRSLQQEVGRDAGGRENRRVIRCVSASCRCTGDGGPEQPACGCRQKPKRPGRAHAWTPDQIDGPYGLWFAIEATAAGPRPPIHRGASGHGGWQSRRAEGQQ